MTTNHFFLSGLVLLLAALGLWLTKRIRSPGRRLAIRILAVALVAVGMMLTVILGIPG